MCRGMNVIWHDREYKAHDTALKIDWEPYTARCANVDERHLRPAQHHYMGEDEISCGQPEIQPSTSACSIELPKEKKKEEAPCAYKWFLNGRLRRVVYDKT
jgi:hypothetical protein